MARRTFLACFILLLFLSLSNGKLHAGEPPPSDLAQKISVVFDTPELRAGFQGIVIQSLKDGRTLYEQNADRLFLPASTNKILTSAAALALLTPKFRYHTRLFADGQTDRQGILHGDLILCGGGDPLLSFADLRAMAQAVRKAGIKCITGKLFYDESRFNSQRLGDGWAWDDAPYDYAAQISALNFNENVITIHIAAGAKEGETVRTTVEPNIGYVTLENHALTAKSTPKTPLDCIREPGTNHLILTGELPKNAKRTLSLTIENPARFTVLTFLFALEQSGIICSMGNNYEPLRNKKLHTIAEHVSAPLSELLPKMNKPSDNLMAECLLKTIGAERSGIGSAEKGVKSETAWLESVGIDKNSVHLSDGSGLSRYNEVAPRSLVRLLAWLYYSPYRSVFTDSLPIAGVDGTMKNRLRETAAANNCRAKTGTMAHVSNLTGYVATADGEPLTFAILMNNQLATPKVCHAVQDKIVLFLAEYSAARKDTKEEKTTEQSRR